MPLYTYICTKCGKKFELLVGVTLEKLEFKCKNCGSREIKRIFEGFSIKGGESNNNFSGPSCPTGTCPLG